MWRYQLGGPAPQVCKPTGIIKDRVRGGRCVDRVHPEPIYVSSEGGRYMYDDKLGATTLSLSLPLSLSLYLAPSLYLSLSLSLSFSRSLVLSLSRSLCLSLALHIYIHMYIYIEREEERDAQSI